MLPFRTSVFLFCVAVFPAITATAQPSPKVPLRFAHLELTDGRTFEDVVVRSYDAKSEKLLILTAGKAMTIPIALVPAPFNEKLKAAPASGASVSTTPTTTRPTAAATPAPAEQAEVAVAVPEAPAAPVESDPTAPTERRAPPRPRVDAAPAEASPIHHQFVARARANRHYRYEYQVGAAAVSITSLDFEFTTPTPIPGWAGRCRTEGKAFLEYYDTKGGSVQRATSTFEVVTEKKPGEELKVIEFTRKS